MITLQTKCVTGTHNILV